MAFPKKEGVVSEVTIFNGYTYRRYPNSANPAHRRYFSRTGHRLHRDVWEFYNGAIPEGYDVHHLDGDTGNNEISNLECLPRKAHRSQHAESYKARGRTPEQLAHLARIRPLTKKWHSSPEGKEWHRQNAYNSIRRPNAPKAFSKSHYTGACKLCGSHFEAKSPRKEYCSQTCVHRKYRAERRDKHRALSCEAINDG